MSSYEHDIRESLASMSDEDMQAMAPECGVSPEGLTRSELTEALVASYCVDVP